MSIATTPRHPEHRALTPPLPAISWSQQENAKILVVFLPSLSLIK